ncbi:MAG: hypothetical protein H6737_00955 [Alphaproteobacteria bacterium]|nr:hypothetical protein [Alphaproteobacteria bacterium]
MIALQTEHFTVHQATPADNRDICRLFREVHVSGELDLNQERDPDFFALQALHHGDARTWVARDPEGRASAIFSAIARPAYLDGQLTRSAYLCDLRVRPGFRGGALLLRHYHDLLKVLLDDLDVRVCTTVVFDDNTRAHQALLGASAARRGQPTYRPMTPFDMVSVQFTRRRRAPKRTVHSATPADIDALAAFLDRRGRERLLGEVFADGLLQKRLADWPGLSIDDFLLVKGDSGQILGCVAPWDTYDVKRTRVLGYHGRMKWVKRGFDVGAALLRWPKLPAAGDCFRFAFLTHLEVEDDDPELLEPLLREAYRRLRPKGLHFMSACVPRGSRLEAAFSGYTVQHTAMTLYAVHLPGGPLAERSFKTLAPGFEMALS